MIIAPVSSPSRTRRGGVGKTTTAINLGAALARLDKRVLIVDLDPQGNASTGLGIVPSDRMLTTYDLLVDDASLRNVVLPTQFEGLFIAPATTDLSSTDVDLVDHENRVRLLRDALRNATDLKFDIILIDCPPSLSLLTVNALVAADAALVPLQTEFFALEGLSQLLLTVRQVAGIGQSGPARGWRGADHVRSAQQPLPPGRGGTRARRWAIWSIARGFPAMCACPRHPPTRFRSSTMTLPPGEAKPTWNLRRSSLNETSRGRVCDGS